jgi:hypothetical protein
MRTCDRCGKPLTTYRSDARFCSERCRARWNNKHRTPKPPTSIRIDGGRSAQGQPRTGIRGGHLPPLSLADVQTLFESWRRREYGWVRAHILLQAAEAGEWHSDHAAEWELAQPNLIGAAVNALAKAGLLVKLNRRGEIEHRPGASKASHGRASYVWTATLRGEQVARALYKQRQAHIGFFKSAGVGAAVPPAMTGIPDPPLAGRTGGSSLGGSVDPGPRKSVGVGGDKTATGDGRLLASPAPGPRHSPDPDPRPTLFEAA